MTNTKNMQKIAVNMLNKPFSSLLVSGCVRLFLTPSGRSCCMHGQKRSCVASTVINEAHVNSSIFASVYVLRRLDKLSFKTRRLKFAALITPVHIVLLPPCSLHSGGESWFGRVYRTDKIVQ